MSAALNLHKIICSECVHEFYVELPEIPVRDTTIEKITDCVECNEELKRRYTITVEDDKTDIELTVEPTNNE